MPETPLRKARKARRLTQSEVAKRVRISQEHFSRIERGTDDQGTVSAATAARIAKVFRRQGLTELHVMYPRRREFRDFRPAA